MWSGHRKPKSSKILLCSSNLTIGSIQITFFMFYRDCLVRSKEQLRDFPRDWLSTIHVRLQQTQLLAPVMPIAGVRPLGRRFRITLQHKLSKHLLLQRSSRGWRMSLQLLNNKLLPQKLQKPLMRMWFRELFEQVQSRFSASSNLYLFNGLGREGTSAFDQVNELSYCTGWSRQGDTNIVSCLPFLSTLQTLQHVVWEMCNSETNIWDS